MYPVSQEQQAQPAKIKRLPCQIEKLTFKAMKLPIS